MTTISVTDARANLPELISKVQQGDEVSLTRHGQVVAVLVAPGRPRSRAAAKAIAEAGRLHDQLAQAASSPLPSAALPAPLSAQRAEDLVATIRRDRDS